MNVIINGVNLERGTKVLLSVPDDFSEEEIRHIKEQLEKQFLGVKFFLISGVEIIGAYNTTPELLEIEDIRD